MNVFKLKPSLNLCPQRPPSLKSQQQQTTNRMTETENVTQPVKKWKRNISDDEGREWDGEGKDRSWWTAVGLFTPRICLFSRCLAAHRGKWGEGEKERQREGQGRRRMWVIGGLAEFARLDSSWCVLWLALSKGFAVSNRQSVVGMPCHGIRQETPGSTVTNHIPTYHLQKQKWIWSANLKVINSGPHAKKWFSALLLLTLPHGALIWLYFQVLWPEGFCWQWPLCLSSRVSQGRGSNRRIWVCC